MSLVVLAVFCVLSGELTEFASLQQPCSLVVLSVPICVVILAGVAVGVKSLCQARHKSVTTFLSGTV